ncbi:MAG: hypothetical protein JWN78_2473 [Bacteroidota bacterium]|nr:hypothetical protein [Bacteroidota bacterium]
MIHVNNRVRHIDKELDKLYGILQVWELKGEYATCRYGDFHNFNIVTLNVSDIKKVDE